MAEPDEQEEASKGDNNNKEYTETDPGDEDEYQPEDPSDKQTQSQSQVKGKEIYNETNTIVVQKAVPVITMKRIIRNTASQMMRSTMTKEAIKTIVTRGNILYLPIVGGNRF